MAKLQPAISMRKGIVAAEFGRVQGVLEVLAGALGIWHYAFQGLGCAIWRELGGLAVPGFAPKERARTWGLFGFRIRHAVARKKNV
jgi:hypothetical protein